MPFASDAPLPEVAAPAGLTDLQRAVWDELAPFALAQRTLVPATAHKFKRLCAQIVMEQRMAEKLETEGLTETRVSLQMDEKGGGIQTVEQKAHTLLSKWISLSQRIDTGMTAFRLAPTGRALAPPQEKTKSALDTLRAKRPDLRAVR